MATTILRGTTSVRLRFLLGVTGLTHTSSGLIVSTITDNEATATVYTQAASNLEDITALGTYAAPSSGKARIKEVDATNHPGLYEIQLADARFNVSGSSRLVITCSGAGLPATGVHYEVDIAADANVKSWRDLQPNVLVSSRVDVSVGAIASNAITATSIASNAITDAKIASGALTAAKFASGAFDAVWTVTTRTLSAFGFSVTVGTNNDKTGYSLTQAFPANFASLGINGSGHVSRVTLVDTTTANTDMRGTDNALLAASYTAPPTPNQIMGGLVTGTQPAGSLARFVRDIKQSDVLFEGQIVSAGSDTAILDAGATTVCVGQAISIGAEGDIERQTRYVTAFDVATNEVTLDRPWCVVPSNGADYQIKTNRNPLVGRTSTALVGSYGAAIHDTADLSADTYDILDTLTEDSAGLRYTAKALEQAPAGGGGGGTVIVQPVAGTTPARTQGATIRTFNGENYVATVAGVDAQGNVIDWTTLSNLEFVVDQPDGTDLAVIADANITKTTTSFSVTIPAAANVIPSGMASIPYRWSIRNATTKLVVLEGPLIVTRTALKD